MTNSRSMLPKPHSTQMQNVILAVYSAMRNHRDSWNDTKEFYLHNPNVTGVGRDLGTIMENLELLAHGMDDSEWLLIGVDVR